MSTIFLFCAVIGGTILVCQSLMTLVGLGGDHGGGDHDFSMDHGGAPAGDHDLGHDGDGDHSADHGSAGVFRMLTLRTAVAAIAFFGLTGLATKAADWDDAQSVVTAVCVGALAMWGVHQMMQTVARLRADGTVRLREAVGRTGSVYLRIPANDQGMGKIHLTLKNQTVELSACSTGKEIPTGNSVRVLRVLGPDLVEVEPSV